jgi:alpha-amylase/alpha-mannosidase (GH57 family)
MSTLFVNFLWHFHQPYYRDPVSGHFALPWVRLHAVKDYIGMARLLAEFPRLKQTINFGPSLLRQLEEYQAGATDTAMLLARVPAEELDEEQAIELMNTFFAANPETMIGPHPRFRQLQAHSRFSRRPVKQVIRDFAPEDLRDLQVWGNLAWFHPTVVEADPELAELIEKGRGFTEAEKRLVLDRQRDVMAEIIPLHRRLRESGQLELIASPFYHAIIPLLSDHTLARVAQPGLPLPVPMIHGHDDAREQVERALDYHEQTFGARPRGMWPSEGAVSNEAAAVFARAGVEWVVTDEEILAETVKSSFARDGAGRVDQPETLYRPYRFLRGDVRLTVVFRDHALSDLIGFRYQLREPLEAAKDLLARLERIRAAAPDNALVVIALDGENCWEYYPAQGVPFLRHLYRLLSEAADIETTGIGEYLDRFPPDRSLDRLYPGSWIHHCFSSWMGHWQKNRAWEHLARAREFVHRRLAEGNTPPEQAAAAREELLIAEGSDWFWWYGDEHSTGSDQQFDALFRKHVRRAYELLDTRPPDELLAPVMQRPVHESWTVPRQWLDITVDGRRTSFFEWLAAGRYEQAHDQATMHRSEPVPVPEVQFGLSTDAVFLLLDIARDDTETPGAELAVELWLGDAELPALTVTFTETGYRAERGDGSEAPGVEAAWDRVVEIGTPLDVVGLERGQTTLFFVRVLESGCAVQRLPASGSIPLEVPADTGTAYPSGQDLV